MWLKDKIKIGREITSEVVRYHGNDHNEQLQLHVCKLCRWYRITKRRLRWGSVVRIYQRDMPVISYLLWLSLLWPWDKVCSRPVGYRVFFAVHCFSLCVHNLLVISSEHTPSSTSVLATDSTPSGELNGATVKVIESANIVCLLFAIQQTHFM